MLRCVIFMDRRRFWHILDPPPERAHCAPLSSSPRAPLSPTSPRAGHARVVYHSSSRSEVRLLHTSRSRARRAPRSPPRPRARRCPSVPSEKPCRMRGSHAASSRGRARGGDDRTAETRAIGVSARAFFFPNHRRASSDPARVPTRSQTRARGGRAELRPSANMGGSAGGFDTTKVWSPAGGWFADPKYWKRNTMLGFAFLGVASATISTTAGRWSRGRSRPPAGSPARRGAPTSPREARRRGLLHRHARKRERLETNGKYKLSSDVAESTCTTRGDSRTCTVEHLYTTTHYASSLTLPMRPLLLFRSRLASFFALRCSLNSSTRRRRRGRWARGAPAHPRR